ncbi:S-adenosylmethionine:tRNA ribosyltransferase-isomerase [Cytobacillus praedii]|uniref:S-adenosylmethionine:tRNA ribosyltransferase-isomerase n=1 Tax=Cytobacillus praedii TaxID=1742358 RepID=A0A4V2NU67_9BACI|nr:S-adenosylmethionine:tRNA ribosyltransferase-isomerase [Cytobacillus praedii]MED3550642.1 S-adenosylmethionine:tRNA ribosyltransferase-isomerase [Cytobacillus praedii]TCJ03131.1 S-adenosylmethionine:tRNA ribosyltransferase-isomerase [Cytobacillus praedii]
MMSTARSFQVPEYLNARTPAEYRGISRDHVRLMTLDTVTGDCSHNYFNMLDSYLAEGDLLVLNNSRTIPAVLKGKRGRQAVEIRLSRKLSDREWEALIVGEVITVGEKIDLPGGLTATIAGLGAETPLIVLSFSKSGLNLIENFYQYGEPLHYEYIETPWPIEMYQTVYASVPGSVEMPSAGRAFTWRLLNKLKEKGVNIAYLQLHAGLSYYGNDRWPHPNKHLEEFCVPLNTAEMINKTREKNGRVIAVGTTVVRALETAVNIAGYVVPQKGITSLYIQKGYPLKAVDGLITGFHEPEASHLDLLSAFIDKDLLMKAYKKALANGYLWHEFGDMNLILPMDERK